MTGPRTVWIASYPKSGNTWVRAMLADLTSEAVEPDAGLNDLLGGPIASSREHIERMIGFPTGDLTRAELALLRPVCDAAFDRMLDEVRFRKIHDALLAAPAGSPIVPPERTRGAVYVVRDPRDVAVSLAYHGGKDQEWAVAELGDPDAAIVRRPEAHYPQMPQRLGTWSGHVREWTEHDLFPVVVVRYEDLIADPLAELVRLVELAGLDPPRERLEAAVRSTSFAALRERERRRGFEERPASGRPFFRRGEAGAWRDELEPALAARIERDHGEVMASLGYEAAASDAGVGATARTSSRGSPS
ncbi:MAG TPA: sulfotransferase domain-containing protein [Thermoleophilaceae bacterium]|nr:sulfotransferase domain-containing protein [Thermoleophilaceae bacterium]